MVFYLKKGANVEGDPKKRRLQVKLKLPQRPGREE